ncbi:hypothetical protein B484DRAFT_446113 [Ochromonadaceae sp. CCMP2298]|nr:hypothetical protein B484DRAFT_446113 [Ochromonadaceae sp. CCMP2298]
MNAQKQGFSVKNEQIFQEQKETGSAAELVKKNPHLGNMMRVANWTAGQLKGLNFSGDLLHLRTLPGGSVEKRGEEGHGEGVQGVQGVQFNGSFELWMVLRIGDRGGNSTSFEAHVAYDKTLYRRPHLALLHAWVLGPSEERVIPLDLPPPRVIPTFFAWIKDQAEVFLSNKRVVWTAVVMLGLLLLTTAWEFTW